MMEPRITSQSTIQPDGRNPSDENATELTDLECPSSGFPMASPVSASHRGMVLIDEPDTIRDPLGHQENPNLT